MVKWSNNSIDNCSKLDTSQPTFVKQWLLIYFLFVCTILSFTFPTFSPAEEKTACNASECNYTVQFDRPGFYIAVVTLPPNQREGVWSLIIDPPTAHLGSFHGGGVLKENGTVPSWVAFSLAQAGVVYIDPFNYPNDPVPFRLELMKEQENKQYQSVWGPTLVNPGQRYTTTSLEPGFYVAVANSTGSKDFFGLSLWNPTLFGGVSGGWLDSQTGIGLAAFDITRPQTVNFKLWFGQIYGDLGTGQPHFQIYYQDEEGTRTLYWSVPQSLQPEYKPKPPSTQLPIDPDTNWEDTVKFLYTGNNPVQTPVIDKNGQSVPINIDPNGAVIILGKVVNSLGQPLPGVKVTVEGCQECGQTLTAEGSNFIATGEFALAVNPGTLTVKYEKEGYVPLQRQVEIACSQTVSRINAIALVTRDEGGGLQLSQGSSAAQGGAVSDTAGSRQARLFFPPGTVATMILPNCSEKQLVDPHIRITEYTQGDPGVEGESTGMPFELPPGTGYTYAVEFSVDEAVKENAREVKFNQPVISYVDNFLGFPVGVPVPSGYYDYNLEAWIPSENGYVINILGGDASGQPLFDFAGQPIVFSNEEKQQIVQWFGNEEWYQTKQGKSFWRTPLMHFSPIDLNYPRVPDPDAKDPDVPEAPDNDKKEKDPCEKSGCIIEAENQVLGEVLPVAGTPFSLNYRSNRVPGRKAAYALDIPLRTETLPQSLKRIRLEIDIGGRRKIEEIFCNEQNPNVKDCNNPAPPVYYFVWDGKDDLGRPLPGSHTATIKIDYLYNAYYLFPADFAKSFGLEGTVQDNSVRVPARQEIAKSKSYTRQLGGLDARTTEGLGGWTLDIHHVYDNINGVLYEGSGGQRQVQFTPKPEKPAKPQPVAEPEPEPQPEPLPPQVIDLTDEMRVSYCIQQCTTPNQCVADCGKVLVGSAHVESDSVQWIGAESANSFVAKSTGDEAFGFTGGSRYLTESAGENEWLFQDTQSVSILNPHAFNDSPSLGFFFAPKAAGQLEATTFYSAAKTYELTDPPKYGTGMKTVIVRGEGKADDKINPAITLDIALNDAPPVIADAAAQCVPATQATVFTVTPRLKRDSALLAEVQPVQQVIVDLEVKEKNTPQCSSFTDDMVTANNFAFGDYFHYLNEHGPNNPLTGCVRHYSFLVGVDKPFQFKALRQHDTQNDTYPKGFVQYAFSVRSHLTGNPAEYQGSYKKFHLASSSSNNRAGSLTSVRAGARSCSVTDNQLLFDGRVASQDGGLLYEFEQSRHVRTLDSLTGQAIYTFGYNDKGYLVKVTDIDGDVTTIERDANNHPVAMVAPYGPRTVLTLDANGYLASATNDAGEVHQLVSTADGLLTQYIDPRNNVEIYEYDVLGLFVKNTTPIGGGYTIAKTDLSDGGYVTTLTSREGRQSRYQITTKDGKKVRLNTAPDGTATISSEEGDGLKS